MNFNDRIKQYESEIAQLQALIDESFERERELKAELDKAQPVLEAAKELRLATEQLARHSTSKTDYQCDLERVKIAQIKTCFAVRKMDEQS